MLKHICLFHKLKPKTKVKINTTPGGVDLISLPRDTHAPRARGKSKAKDELQKCVKNKRRKDLQVDDSFAIITLKVNAIDQREQGVLHEGSSTQANRAT